MQVSFEKRKGTSEVSSGSLEDLTISDAREEESIQDHIVVSGSYTSITIIDSHQSYCLFQGIYQFIYHLRHHHSKNNGKSVVILSPNPPDDTVWKKISQLGNVYYTPVSLIYRFQVEFFLGKLYSA